MRRAQAAASLRGRHRKRRERARAAAAAARCLAQRAIRTLVRVVLERQLAVGLLDFVGRGAGRHAQHLVIARRVALLRGPAHARHASHAFKGPPAKGEPAKHRARRSEPGRGLGARGRPRGRMRRHVAELDCVRCESKNWAAGLRRIGAPPPGTCWKRRRAGEPPSKLPSILPMDARYDRANCGMRPLRGPVPAPHPPAVWRFDRRSNRGRPPPRPSKAHSPPPPLAHTPGAAAAQRVSPSHRPPDPLTPVPPARFESQIAHRPCVNSCGRRKSDRIQEEGARQ
jgi:hypothetical protein